MRNYTGQLKLAAFTHTQCIAIKFYFAPKDDKVLGLVSQIVLKCIQEIKLILFVFSVYQNDDLVVAISITIGKLNIQSRIYQVYHIKFWKSIETGRKMAEMYLKYSLNFTSKEIFHHIVILLSNALHLNIFIQKTNE